MKTANQYTKEDSISTKHLMRTYLLFMLSFALMASNVLTSCGRPTFSYNNGRLIKEPRLRPGKGYAITLALSIGIGEQYKTKSR